LEKATKEAVAESQWVVLAQYSSVAVVGLEPYKNS
jgi:hypothetical protein